MPITLDTVTELPSDRANDSRAQAKTRAFVRWDKVFDNGSSRIWHLRFRRFYYKDYKRQNHVSVIENPQTLGIGLTICDEGNKRTRDDRIIISFKGGKIAVYKRSGTRLRAFYTPWAWLDSKMPYSHVLTLPDPIAAFPGLMRCERRLMDLFLVKARANGVKVSPYARRAAKTMGELITYILYPAVLDIRSIREWKPGMESVMLSKCLRRPFKQSLKLIAGHDSRKLTKLVLARTDLTGSLVRLRLLKGLLPIDYLHQVVAHDGRAALTPDASREWQERWRNTRAFLRQFKGRPAVLVRWVKEHPDWMWNDTIRMWSVQSVEPGFQMPDSNDLQVIHDELSRRQRARWGGARPIECREIKHPQALIDLNLDRLKVGDYTIAVPKTTHDLIRWGNEMSNCIGGYTYHVESGGSWILGLIKDDKCHYGIQIDPSQGVDQFVQFKGLRNVDAPDELVIEMREVMGQARDKADALVGAQFALDMSPQ